MAEAANGAYRRSMRLMNGAVMRENLVISESMSGEKISEEAIREALSRILESAMFI
jgi:Flp pilus assembly protein CpaB